MPVFRVVTLDKVFEVFKFHGLFLQGEVYVGPEIVDPDIFCFEPWSRGGIVEKDDVCFDSGFVKDACRKPEDGVKIAGFKEFFPYGFSRSSFKENVIWNYHGCFTSGFEEGFDVLEEVKLFV